MNEETVFCACDWRGRMSDLHEAREAFKDALRYRRDYDTEYPSLAAEKYIGALEANLAAAEERVRELEARWTEAWCPNCHAVIEQCPYCGYDTAPDCFVRDRARLTATEQEEES